MSLQTSNIFAALDTKKKKKSSKSSKDTGDKKKKEAKEPDRCGQYLSVALSWSGAHINQSSIYLKHC